jgi:hypothetical protein
MFNVCDYDMKNCEEYPRICDLSTVEQRDVPPTGGAIAEISMEPFRQ